MFENINIYCSNDDRAWLEWFLQVLSSRMITPLLVAMDIVYGDEHKSDLPSDRRRLTVWIPKKPRTPVEMEKVFDRFCEDDWIICRDKDTVLDIDIVGFTLWMLNREEEFLQKNDPACWDKWGRFKLEKTLAYKKGLWQQPVVDILFLKLIETFETVTALDLLNEAPWGKKTKAVWLTHDVDKLTGKYALPLRVLGWIGLATLALIKRNKNGFVKWLYKCKNWLLTDEDPTYESILKLMHRNAQLNAKGTFFFMSLRNGVSIKEGIRYPIGHRKLLEIFKRITESGCSIGLHPGLNRSKDIEYLTTQKANLQHILKNEINLVRNHYLRVTFPDAWAMEENAGFKISSNAGWPSHDGFRAGTCWPYHPFDIINNQPFEILEVPLVYMDNKIDDEKSMVRDALVLADEVAAVHGILTVNFHSTLFDKFEMSNRGNAYNELLEICWRQDWLFIEDRDILKLRIDAKINSHF